MNEFPYDTSYDPALPICDVTFSVATTGNKISLPEILDTGADATLVPQDLLQELGSRRTFEMWLRSQWGERRVVFLHLVDIQIGEIILPGIYVVGDDLGNEVILGRDVLNRLRLLLDGPERVTKIFLDGEKPLKSRR
jgi:predicted aspartyl protease